MSAFIIVSFSASATGIKVSGAGKITGNICCNATGMPLESTTVIFIHHPILLWLPAQFPTTKVAFISRCLNLEIIF